MLATFSSSPPQYFAPYNAFLPAHPSPLSPRSTNIHGSGTRTSMSSSHASPTGQENTSTTSVSATKATDTSGLTASRQAHVPFAKRTVKKAPSPGQDELKDRRRRLFLKRVDENREAKRWEGRGEDIMRLDFVQQRRAWEAERAREAGWMGSQVEEDDEEREDGEVYGLPTSSAEAVLFSQPSTEVGRLDEGEVAEEVARVEDEELAALLELMPADDEMAGERGGEKNLWSDDDDEMYEELFDQLLEKEGEGQTQAQGQEREQGVHGEGEAMDMS